MEKLNILHVTDRQDWRAWLEQNFDQEKEIWLVYPKKESGKPRIVYNDAVEEALCFGWIDSTIKTIDPLHTAQRFTPRNPKSSFSQPNKERLQWLYEQNLLHPSVVPIAEKVIQEKFIFPPDIIEALQADPIAWQHYQQFSPAYQRIRVAFIDGARKRPSEFKKRLAHFIEKTKANKQIGFGGIEKYY